MSCREALVCSDTFIISLHIGSSFVRITWMSTKVHTHTCTLNTVTEQRKTKHPHSLWRAPNSTLTHKLSHTYTHTHTLTEQSLPSVCAHCSAGFFQSSTI